MVYTFGQIKFLFDKGFESYVSY
ncbi:hypothetical protein RG963_15010 [Methanosarcina sp. Z-7115]|uniref:Mobile element protein n=1 Tax=Methanosarcina baikalica TaxID=3073890 RepID=A0ABU2D533_9EURY|nr:hypothetical protein [Methanosarcina sp. Z-7115]MDR7667060.1 hypothetical protein [Methanosarcina sp. Z-7115]